MPQAKKKARSAVPEAQQITHRLSESFFILTILLAVFLLACLVSYDPADPGPFNTVASDQVSNLGRVLGAWLANALLFLTGYLAWTIPLVVAYGGIRALQGISLHVDEGEIVTLIGSNGAGKSSTLRAIVGLVAEGIGGVHLPRLAEHCGPVQHSQGALFLYAR